MPTQKTKHEIVRFGIAVSSLLGVLGILATFYPGAETGWFGTAACVAILGLLSPKRNLRLIATGLIVVFGLFAWVGYQRGLQYQAWLNQNPL